MNEMVALLKDIKSGQDLLQSQLETKQFRMKPSSRAIGKDQC